MAFGPWVQGALHSVGEVVASFRNFSFISFESTIFTTKYLLTPKKYPPATSSKVLGDLRLPEAVHLVEHPDGGVEYREGANRTGAFAQTQPEVE